MRGTQHPDFDNQTGQSPHGHEDVNTLTNSGQIDHEKRNRNGSHGIPAGTSTSKPAPQTKSAKGKRGSNRPADLQARLPMNTVEPYEQGSFDDADKSQEIPEQPNATNDASLLSELGNDNWDGEGFEDVAETDLDHGLERAREVWRNALSQLALNMPAATYHTWMRETHVIGYEDGEFIIGVPNAYACDWIKNRLKNQIKRTLHSLEKRSVQVNFRVVTSPIPDEESAQSAPLYSQSPMSHNTGQHGGTGNSEMPTRSQPSPNNNSVGFLNGESNGSSPHGADAADDLTVDDSSLGANKGSGAAGRGSRTLGGQMNGSTHNQRQSIELNQHHTFDTFVVGNHNRMAHAAAEAISDRPGASFNPLFIYGGVGLGKTHLLHAIGNRAQSKGFSILYCTSEQFTNELILAIRSQSTEDFRNKYRHVDILLIDDIQFIGGKESTQEEFFHTFNHLHAAGRQVILSSDRPPKALPTLEERLRSRFEGGLQTDISKPDFETRVAILQSKAASIGLNVETAALMLIAERVDSNIRELEGALNRIALQARLFSNQLDVALAESVLKNLAPERTLQTPAAVIEIVADHYRLTVDDLKSRSRTKEIAHARQVAMYILREENGMSLPSIGDHLGGRDHSTVRHGVDKIIHDIEHTESVRHEVMALREKIYAAPSF